jgi:hypothetical protein
MGKSEGVSSRIIKGIKIQHGAKPEINLICGDCDERIEAESIAGLATLSSSMRLRALVGGALHQHKLHFSQMYGLRRDQAHRIFLENDGLVFHQSEQFPIEFDASLLPLY